MYRGRKTSQWHIDVDVKPNQLKAETDTAAIMNHDDGRRGGGERELSLNSSPTSKNLILMYVLYYNLQLCLAQKIASGRWRHRDIHVH